MFWVTESFFVEQIFLLQENPSEQFMLFSAIFTTMYEWDHHRSCWRYKDKAPDLVDKFPNDVNPYQFADVFKITYEHFVVLVDWLVTKPIETNHGKPLGAGG